MKLNRYFINQRLGEETLLVPAGKAQFSGIVRGNKTFGAVLDLLKTETTEEQIVASIRARFDAPEGVVEQDVHAALAQLREIGALDE